MLSGSNCLSILERREGVGKDHGCLQRKSTNRFLSGEILGWMARHAKKLKCCGASEKSGTTTWEGQTHVQVNPTHAHTHAHTDPTSPPKKREGERQK